MLLLKLLLKLLFVRAAVNTEFHPITRKLAFEHFDIQGIVFQIENFYWLHANRKVW